MRINFQEDKKGLISFFLNEKLMDSYVIYCAYMYAYVALYVLNILYLDTSLYYIYTDKTHAHARKIGEVALHKIIKKKSHLGHFT